MIRVSKDKLKRLVFSVLGLLFCTLPVTLCVLKYFPVWVARGGETVFSAFTLVLILISAVPLFSFMKRVLRSPSAYKIWLILFIIFFLMSNIADEMAVISFVGFISNLIGALFFRFAANSKARDKNERQI